MTATKLKKAAEAALTEWQLLALRAARVEAQRLEDIREHQLRFDKACEPVNAAAQEKLEPLQTRMRTLRGEIERELKAGISSDGKSVAVPQVETEKAIAKLKDTGHRVIEPAVFFKQVRPADRDQDFWGCVQVLIGSAAKFLPEAVMKRIAEHAPKYSVVVELKK